MSMQATNIMGLISFSLLLFCTNTAIGADNRFRDFNKEKPFVVKNTKLMKALFGALESARNSKKPCSSVPIADPSTNVCHKVDKARIDLELTRAAPSLEQDRLGVWKTDLNQDSLPEYFITYRQRTFDPMVSYFRIYREGVNFKADYLFSVNGGAIWGINQFGPNPRQHILQIRYQNCYECHPWIYVIFLTVDEKGKTQTFDFTYSKDHKSWDWAIEYKLPGRGHSVDANVESRIITKRSKQGPHLIQAFDYKGGPKVWWVFSCKGLKCDYVFHKSSLPASLSNIWKSGYVIQQR